MGWGFHYYDNLCNFRQLGEIEKTEKPKNHCFLLFFEETGRSHVYWAFPIAYWAFPIAIGRSRLWIGRSCLPIDA